MSLRIRLTLYYTIFFACALLLLDLGTYMAVRQSLMQGVQNDLKAGAEQVLAIYRADRTSGLERIVTPNDEILFQVRGAPVQVFSNRMLSAQVFSPQGHLVGSSPEPDQAYPPLLGQAIFATASEGPIYKTWENGQQRVRSLTVPLTVNNLVVGYLQISRTLDDVERTLQLLLFIMLGGGTIALMAAATGVFWLSRAALSPIEQVAHTAQSIVRAEDLGQRVPVPTSPDELQRLVIMINELLGRLETLFSAQRRLVADVSHELRTPLAAMQGNLEVLARVGHRDPAVLSESLVDMRRETTRLIRMVNDLLLLAQSEAGVEIRREPVELDTLLLEIHRDLRVLSDDIALRIGAEDQVVIYGDRDRLKQALLNLGANALQHTPPGGCVTLSLVQQNGKACLAVADTGEGIAAEDMPHIFERFYRADRSRSRHGGGAGLGLAIVKWIAESHGGHVLVQSVRGEGSTFTICLPLTRPALPSGSSATIEIGSIRQPTVYGERL